MQPVRRADASPVMPDLKCVPEHVLLGLSGGADSVALLLMLLESGRCVEAVHVNHGLRGAASDGDEAFARTLCAEKRVPLRVYRANPPEAPGEAWARTVRYAFFREAMRETGADALVLAHHQDDQAETVLLHLLRGSGLRGLAGMATETELEGMRVIRPLLGVSRAELRTFLKERGQAWHEDASNRDAKYLRNALRLEVLPRLENLSPGASQRIAATAETLREDEAALEELTECFLNEHDAGRALPVKALMAQPAGLRKRVLRAWWEREGLTVSLNREQTERLARLLEGMAGQTCNLPFQWRAYRGWTYLHLLSPAPTEQAASLSAAAGATLNGVSLTLTAAENGFGDGRVSQCIPEGFLDGLILRTWLQGDWIRPFGCAGRQSLQDYFTNRHVDAPFRKRIPLLCREDEVLLAVGVGAGNVPRMKDASSGVLLRWSGFMPWRQGKDDDE